MEIDLGGIANRSRSPWFTARAAKTLFVDASAVKVQQATITASSPRLRSLLFNSHFPWPSLVSPISPCLTPQNASDATLPQLWLGLLIFALLATC